MNKFPHLPVVEDVPDLLTGGHLWIQECIDGHPFTVQLERDTSLQFSGVPPNEAKSRQNTDTLRETTPELREFSVADIPREYRHAVHYIQRNLDRSALQNAVEDTEEITFSGVATHQNRLDYNWETLPSFLVTDIHDATGSADSAKLLPPARVEQVADVLGLASVNTLAREVRAIDFDPDSYEFPDSEWRDGPVAGVVLRNKTGQRAVLENESLLDSADENTHTDVIESDNTRGADVETLVDEYAPESRYRRVVRKLEGRVEDRQEVEKEGRERKEAKMKKPPFDAVEECVLDGIYREHATVFCHGRTPVDLDAFERAIARRTGEFLAEREEDG